MDKIKNVLHARKKSEDVTHDSHTASSTTEGQPHPIYDEMTDHKAGHSTNKSSPLANVKTTTGEPYTALAQPESTTHGQPQHVGIDGPIGASATPGHSDNVQSEKVYEPAERAAPNTIHDTGDSDRRHDAATGHSSATAGGSLRPNANPTGSEHHKEEMSTASIKSGVIGFGPGSQQEHAARSTHNPTEQYMERDQVLGGGKPGTAAMTEGQGLKTGSSAQPYSQPSSTGRERAANLGHISEDRPYDNTLRQESYTVDTDRSFPLAGGVASRPHEQQDTSTRHATENTPIAQQSAAPTSTLHQQTISEREPGTKEREAGVQEDRGRQGLAGAAAAAAAVGASQAYSHRDRDAKDPEHMTTSPTTGSISTTSHDNPIEDEGLLAKTKRLVGLGGPKDDGTQPPHSEQAPPTGTTAPTHEHNPEALAAATAAASRAADQSSSTQGPAYGAQHRGLASASTTSHGPNFGGGARPQGNRNDSDRIHVPGEFITTPHEHAGSTYLDYHNVVEAPSGTQHNVAPSSTLGTSTATQSSAVPASLLGTSRAADTGADPTSTTGQHELRHTGTLDEPRPKSAEEHHLGRDAAIAGGVGAGAAGLGAYAASRNRDTPDVGSSKPLYEESSPYSSKKIDPRVLGQDAPTTEQRFDPQGTSEVSPHHAAQTSGPAGISSAATTGPSTTDDSARTGDAQHHYGRDAALVGAGAATAGGLHHGLQRNDTPGTGTAVLPQESSYTSPTSGPGAPQQSLPGSAPLANAGSSIPPHASTGDNTFYGASGAPAPVVDKSVQPSDTLGNASSTGPGAVPENDPQHHHGRNAALGGAGLAAVGGGLYAANRVNQTEPTAPSNTIAPGSDQHVGPTSQDPASKTIGPHESNIANILDPRAKPDPSKQKEHTTSGPHQSNTLNKLDPKVDEKAGQQEPHHYGRDAAVVGGAGAAGYGAHEAAKAYSDHRMTQPGASMNEQRYDPAAKSGHGPNPVAAKSEYNYNDPTVQSNVNRGVAADTQHDSHRNAALGTAAGLGAAGIAGGAYARSRHGDNAQQLPIHEKQAVGSSTHSTSQPTPPAAQPSAYSTQGTTAQPTAQSQDVTRDSADQSHDKRNAALLGGAGAAAAGGAAYAYSQQDDRERARLEERQRDLAKKEAHDREKEQHRIDRENAKEQHKLDKEQAKHDKEVHKHDKAVAAHEKEEHKLQKEREKEQHRLEKDEAKRQKEAEKEADGEKKKGGLFGFLHRDKSKKEKSTSSPESSPRNSRDYSPRHSKEYAAGAGALGAGTTATAYRDDHPDSPRYKGKNLLHKDPPPGHPAREALAHQQEGGLQTGKREHIGVDGPIGDPHTISGDRETRHGVYGAHPAEDLAKDTSIIEPHTGLPMNVERYGEGVGGTDGNTNIRGGNHNHATGGGQAGTDWEAIRKADTPY